ncbi:sugar ABC transporter substrate-binding protein [Bacteroidota bacterium]
MKNLQLFIALTFIIIGVFSCRQAENIDQDKPTIALVLKTLNNPFFIDMVKGAEDASEKLDVNLIVQAAEREVDVEKQMQIIENLIERKVDVICVAPSGSKEIVPAIVKANKANIPVIAVDTRVDEKVLNESNGKVIGFIGSDNVDGGRIAGKFIAEKLNGKGKVAVLEGIPGHETGDARLKGFYESVNQYTEIEIVASQTANWERDQGYNVFQNMYQANPDINALFACNDMMALGAVEAISIAGKTGDIIVVGFDAIEDSRIAIKNGTMHGSIAQHPREMGKLAVEYAVKLVNGENIDYEIPVKIELITKEKLSPVKD